MLNGQIIGVHNQPKTLIAGIRLLRRRGKVCYFLYINWFLPLIVITDKAVCFHTLQSRTQVYIRRF